jgi:hypothetical protein
VGETLVICPGLEVGGSERPGDENISGKISTCSLCYSKEKDGGRMQLRRSSYERFPQQTVAFWVGHPLPVASVLQASRMVRSKILLITLMGLSPLSK